ncbi:hypothetical protein, partial [Candidatus Burkholderia verschuerenii]|uniref:hypothetical protein n=1 Tax=Candidatus Burkholderia verschuerenii TaxID=242163 RepID=UPI001E453612
QRHASTSTRALQTWLRCAFTSAPDCVVGSIPANSILQARLCKRRALNVAHPDQYFGHLNEISRTTDTFLIIGFGASSLQSILSALAEIKANL